MNSIDYSSLPDYEISLLIQKGDKKAFDYLYLEFWKPLFNYSFNILSEGQMVEDVLQEVFLNIWTRSGKDSIQNFKSYLFNAVRNKSISKLREVKFSELQQEIIEGLPSESRTAEEHQEIEEKLGLIVKAAEELPERCRQIFILSRIEYVPISEISELLNISRRTVENQLTIAMKYIRQYARESVVPVALYFFCDYLLSKV
ncbi:RNA polymerase sigma factor [Algoriphagus sp. Y33]|uniref:RNA polymerase sigma factor n=1 Tax=Algoriphagus sp. Y33 TaxID=2772483 RepID=UPI0017822DEE|nr:sigma-70 family RNA polymerase sigma factor [Algoriphagus sp. Y33]